jgi:VWFA-related protein
MTTALRALSGTPLHSLLLLSFIAFVAAALAAQERPTFRSAIEAVQFDVIVTDAAGDPVSDLTIDDFEISENGKVQTISTFQAVDIPIERAETVQGERLAELDVLTNETPPGRVYVFALDEVRGPNILRTRRFVRQFIEEHFGPNDVGAIALLGRGLATDGQDFTANRRLLLNAIDRFSGGEEYRPPYPRRPDDDDGRRGTCWESGRLPRSVRTAGRSQQLASLRSLADVMARVPGRHKALLLFSECIDVDVLDLVDYNGGVLGLAGEDAHAVMAALTRSNIAVYPMDPTGLASDSIALEAKAAFRSLGEATGGFALMDSNRFTEAFERIVRENSSYYMLGFNSSYTKDDGKYVRVQVNVKRPGLTVHARGGYVAPTRELRQAEAKARGEASLSAMSAALANPLATSGVPMRVYAAPFKGRGKNAAVAVAVEVGANSLGLEEKLGVLSGKVGIRFLATDAKRNVYPEMARTASVEIRSDPPGKLPLDRIRVRVVSELALPAGRYQVRVAAGDSIVAGNVVYDLEVPDFNDGPLAMSGLMLVAASEPMVLTLNSNTGYAAKAVKCYTERCIAPKSADDGELPLTPTVSAPLLRGGQAGAPTTRREFQAGEGVTLVAEVYENARQRAGQAPSVITLTADLLDAEGRVVPLASEQRPVSLLREGAMGCGFKVELPIADVPPGAYSLRVQARSNADAERVASRKIPIQVRAAMPQD